MTDTPDSLPEAPGSCGTLQCPGRDSNPIQGENNSKQDAPLLMMS